MGFFNALKNIALGKPVFQANQPTGAGEAQQPAGGLKTVPAAYIERVQCSMDGGHMECEAVIQNYAQKELLLDKIEILGKTLFLNGQQLAPGEEYEINVFEGPRPNNTYNSQCLLYYKDQSGDYFCSIHNIEFNKLPDNTYSINYIKFQQLRDV